MNTTTIALIVFILLVIIVWWALSRTSKTHKPDFEVHHEEPKQEAPVIEAPVRAEPMEVPADDLTVVEGVGPRINELLQGAGIRTFDQLAEADPSQLKEILDANGLGFADPASWPEQAKLAAAGKLDELQALKDSLKGGRYAEAAVRAAEIVPDDLTVLEGIGPKINSLLQEAGIQTFAQLAAADLAQVKALLEANGLPFIDPGSWPEQAGLAAAGKMDDLQALQGRLRGGRKVE
jgi:predicted flap endonuclease-1-like 5' DNA nuclease